MKCKSVNECTRLTVTKGDLVYTECAKCGRVFDRQPVTPDPERCNEQNDLMLCDLPKGHFGDHRASFQNECMAKHPESDRECFFTKGHQGKHKWEQ